MCVREREREKERKRERRGRENREKKERKRETGEREQRERQRERVMERDRVTLTLTSERTKQLVNMKQPTANQHTSAICLSTEPSLPPAVSNTNAGLFLTSVGGRERRKGWRGLGVW